MKEIKLNKWYNLDIKSIQDIEKLSDLQRALLITENCLENALCFLKMNIPQEELAKKYFTEATIIFQNIILPYEKEENVSKDVVEKIKKLETLIKDINIEF